MNTSPLMNVQMREQPVLSWGQPVKCPKCRNMNPEGSRFCFSCGKKLVQEKGTRRRSKDRANGAGTAYKKKNGWGAQVVIGWKMPHEEGGHPIPIIRKGGTFPTRAEALAYCPILRGIVTGTAPVEKPKYTLEQVYDMWEPWYESRVKSMAGYKSAFKHFSPLHNTPIEEISAGDLQKCMDDCTNGKRTHQMMKVLAGLIWAYAVDNQYAPSKVTENLYTGKGKSKKREALTEDEVKTIREHLGDGDPYIEYVYALCYLGFRPGEMLELKKDQLHMEKDRMYFIAGKKTEAGTDRIVPIPDQILDIINRRKDTIGTDLVFPMYVYNRRNVFTGYKQMSDDYFRDSVFKPMMARFGIAEGKVPYSALHTYANKLKKASGDDRDKAALIGHSDYTFTQTHYQDTNIDELTDIVKSMV